MSNVIQFLESMGADAALANHSAGQLIRLIEAAEVEDAERAALLAGNTAEIASALGGRPKMFCMIVPAEEDEPAPEQDPDDAPDEQEGDQV